MSEVQVALTPELADAARALRSASALIPRPLTAWDPILRNTLHRQSFVSGQRELGS